MWNVRQPCKQQIEENIFRMPESRGRAASKNASNIDRPAGRLENTAKYKNAANIDKAAGKYHKTQLLKFKLAAYP